MGRAAVVAAAVCLLAPAAAGASRVGWKETAKVAGARVMSYRVDSLSIGKNSWSARVSFTNLSKKTIKVGSQFGVAFYLDPEAEDLTYAVGFAAATKFSTPTPTILKPGATWTGVISGSGQLLMSGRVYARVVFGPFTGVPGESTAIVWITDHKTTLGSKTTTVTPPSTGPVI